MLAKLRLGGHHMMRGCCIDEHCCVTGGFAGSNFHHRQELNIFLHMRIRSMVHFTTTRGAARAVASNLKAL